MKQGKVSLTGLFLSLFLGTIIFTILIAIFNIFSQPAYIVKLTFVILNVLLIVFISTFSKLLINKISLPMYLALAIVTSVYSVLQFVSLAFAFSLDTINFYLVFELILLFVYFLVSIPLIKAGITVVQKSDK